MFQFDLKKAVAECGAAMLIAKKAPSPQNKFRAYYCLFTLLLCGIAFYGAVHELVKLSPSSIFVSSIYLTVGLLGINATPKIAQLGVDVYPGGKTTPIQLK